MNAAALKAAARYLGAWGAIVGCVVLLSFLFTFLGTITCAALIGMMMGAFKGARWFSAGVSLVFPAVVFGMVRGARVELTPQQVTLLAALCFGVFWATYLVSAAVLFCEQKDRGTVKARTSAAQAEATPPSGQAARSLGALEGQSPTATVWAGESGLEQLQGNWVCETASAGGALGKKVIQIKETKLELRTVDASGRTTVLVTGAVTLQGVRASWNHQGIA